MKIERQQFKISLFDTFLYFGLLFVLINGFSFLYTVIEGNMRLLIYDTSWITQLILPLFLALAVNSVNRNGVLKITDFNDLDAVKNKIDLIVRKRGLIKTDNESKLDNYTKKTKWGRFFNLFFREDINVNYSREEILIYGKTSMISLIESKLRFDKNLNDKLTPGVNSVYN